MSNLTKYVLRCKDGEVEFIDVATGMKVDRFIEEIQFNMNTSCVPRVIVNCFDFGLEAELSEAEVEFRSSIVVVLDKQDQAFVSASLEAFANLLEGKVDRAPLLAAQAVLRDNKVAFPQPKEVRELMKKLKVKKTVFTRSSGELFAKVKELPGTLKKETVIAPVEKAQEAPVKVQAAPASPKVEAVETDPIDPLAGSAFRSSLWK